MDTYAKMRRSNAKARGFLLNRGFEDVFFFQHTRFLKDLHFQGLEFDGIASFGNKVVLFQIKSNCKASKKTLEQYEKVGDKFNILCLWINIVDRKGIEVNNEKQY